MITFLACALTILLFLGFIFLIVTTAVRGGWIRNVAAFVLIFVPIGIFVVVSNGHRDNTFKGSVYSKTYHPAYMSTVLAGKSIVVIHVPERWDVVLKDRKGDTRSCDITIAQYDTIQLGQDYHCESY